MSGNDQHSGVLTFGGVCFTAECIFEVGARSASAKVSRVELERISLRYGFQARHPLLLALFGFILLALGLPPLLHVALGLIGGGGFFDVELLAPVWLILGITALWGAFRRGYLLEVETPVGKRRLEFKRGLESSELEAFISLVEQSLGYVVDR
jgi:hypothetical protein